MTFKTINEAIEFLAARAKLKIDGDMRSMRTASFDLKDTHSAHDIINGVLTSIVEFTNENSEGSNLVIDPGSYEALVIVHIREADSADALPRSGNSSGLVN